MRTVRIGIIHRRTRLSFQLPAETRLFSALGEWRGRGELQITVATPRPGAFRYGLRVLESDDRELLAATADLLATKGITPHIVDFAPGAEYGDCRVPATGLLYAELEACVPGDRLLTSHTDNMDPAEREVLQTGGPAGLELLRRLRDILVETPARQGIALWHTGAPSVFRETVIHGESLVNVRLDGRVLLEEGELPLRIELPPGARAMAREVEVGLGFHWQHQRDLEYSGGLLIWCDPAGLLGVANDMDIDLYLASVNSSEMTADCPPALLRAQTIAARSTILATRGRHHAGEPFDICADDHCQCFRGVGTIMKDSLQAARDTSGVVLAWNGLVCDARYSKSCGGIVEAYENVWENQPIPYMSALCDTRDEREGRQPQPRSEQEWIAWIDQDEDAWCNTDRWELPPGLSYSDGYYRWQVRHSRTELAAIIRRKTGHSFHVLEDLVPVSRGASGRLIELELVTDKGCFRLGKELAIRLALSESCLFSAAIYFEWVEEDVVIHGKGWGHGVGMCQLGAARMATEGRDHDAILQHYYPGTRLIKLSLGASEGLNHDLQ